MAWAPWCPQWPLGNPLLPPLVPGLSRALGMAPAARLQRHQPLAEAAHRRGGGAIGNETAGAKVVATAKPHRPPEKRTGAGSLTGPPGSGSDRHPDFGPGLGLAEGPYLHRVPPPRLRIGRIRLCSNPGPNPAWC